MALSSHATAICMENECHFLTFQCMKFKWNFIVPSEVESSTDHDNGESVSSCWYLVRMYHSRYELGIIVTVDTLRSSVCF